MLSRPLTPQDQADHEHAFATLAKMNLPSIQAMASRFGLTDFSTCEESLFREQLKSLLRQRLGLPAHSEAATVAQQAMWFLQKVHPDSTAQTIRNVFRLPEGTDLARLEGALRAVIQDHPILRTTYQAIEASGLKVIQIVHPDPRLCIEHICTPDWQETLGRCLGRPLDLEAGPVLRTYLLETPKDGILCAFHLHHIAGDATTFERLQRDLWRRYLEGDTQPCPAPGNPFQAFVAQETLYLDSDDHAQDKAYWSERYGTLPPRLDFLPNREGTSQSRPQRAIVPSVLDEQTSRLLLEGATAIGATPYRFFLGLLFALIHRCTGQPDLVVGAPVSMRRHAKYQEAMGYFVNMLPFRIQVDPDETMGAFLKRLDAAVREDLRHGRYPFARMVADRSGDRDASGNPFFRISFAMERTVHREMEGVAKLGFGGEGPGMAPHGVTLEAVPFYSADSEFELALFMEIIQGRIHLWAMHQSDIFSEATVTQFLKHLCHLGLQAIAHPDRSLGELNLLDPQETQRILVDWNPTALPAPDLATLPVWFERHVEAAPDAPALSFESRTTTYGALNAQANRMARALQAQGVLPGGYVPVCLDPHPDMVASLFGILKAGAAYVPINPAYPKERAESIVQDVAPRVVITERKYAPHFASFQGTLLLVEDLATLLAPFGTQNLDLAIPLQQPAYVIYTSGSTGRPKGVVITHRNVSRLFTATDPWFHFGPSDVWTLFHSFAFDFSVWEIFGALLYGGRLVIVPYLASRNPGQFLDLLSRERVTVLNQTPSAFRQLCQCLELAPDTDLSALRHVVFGGEALELRSLQGWFSRFGDRSPRMINMYGITETTVHVTYRPITVEDCQKDPGSLIGQPIPDLRLYILDEALRPVPPGWPGEICVGGEGLAEGYLHREDLTRDRFRDVELPGLGRQRLYRSGDLARYRHDGDIEYLGRKDQQVKIRGFRIELGDIESKLGEHPAIRSAVVMPEAGPSGAQILKGYLVLEPEAHPCTADLKAFLGEKLPDYMIPAHFASVSEIPLTVNNKTDARRLAELAQPLDGAPAQEARIDSALGRKIADIWRQILKVEHVHPASNFFDLGGDSLTLVQVCNRLHATVSPRIQVVDLFEYPSLEALTRRIHQLEEPEMAHTHESSGLPSRRLSSRSDMASRRPSRSI